MCHCSCKCALNITIDCKALQGEPEERHLFQSLHTRMFCMGCVTAEELVDGIQTDHM